MTLIAPTLQAFFTDRLTQQHNASPHTVVAYRRTFCLLLRFVQERDSKEHSRLDFAGLNAALVVAFLRHLEDDRGNSVRSRNAASPPFTPPCASLLLATLTMPMTQQLGLISGAVAKRRKGEVDEEPEAGVEDEEEHGRRPIVVGVGGSPLSSDGLSAFHRPGHQVGPKRRLRWSRGG